MINLTYNGKSFNQRESDGYVNLGELCATHGKKFGNWTRLQGSKEYLATLAETLMQSESHICASDYLVVSEINAIGGKAGTWGHPFVAIEVARWISKKFGIWCNQHIKTLIETGSTTIAPQPQPHLPQTFSQALYLAAKLQEEKELIEAEKQLLEEEIYDLSEALDELFDYFSIIRIAIFNKVSEKQFSWRKLKSASVVLKKEIKKAPCPRFGTKNLYSHDAWRLAYPGVALPEATTLAVKRSA